MNIKKLEKLWFRCKQYEYIHIKPVDTWDFQLHKYEGPGKYTILENNKKITVGSKWGRAGDTGVFSAIISVPEEYRGYSVYLEIITGGEAQAFIDDMPFQGNDPNHYLIQLPSTAGFEKQFAIRIESYIRRNMNDYGEFEYDKACTGEFTQADLCAVHKEAREFLWDIEFALELAKTHEEYSRSIENALSHIFFSFNITCREDFLSYAEDGRKYLTGILDSLADLPGCPNVWMIGQSHLDFAWLWRKNESCRKVVRTFSTALRYLERYPFFRFMMPQVMLYKTAKEMSEVLFSEVKKYIDEGRWELGGIMLVEPETNLVSGEYLVRQILYGRRFLKEEFGRIPEVECLIDTFGYSGNLPQILNKSGIKSVMVTKMVWGNDTNAFPYSAFIWKGIDGSSIMAGTMPWFNRKCTPEEVKANTDRNLQKGSLNDIPIFYGWGDGGGGPDENHIQGLERLVKWYKPARIISGSLEKYFEKLSTIKEKLPVWRGEIYLEGHRGCYTSQAEIKKLNRESENLYRSLEWLSGILYGINGKNYFSRLEENLELILLNQFHDILPGSSIHAVYEDSKKDYEKILGEGHHILDRILEEVNGMVKTEGKGISVIVWCFNAFTRSECIKVKWDGPQKGKLYNGENLEIPYRISDGFLYFTAKDLPSIGYTTYRFIEDETVSFEAGVTEEISYIENERFIIGWNDDGQINRIYDRIHNRELIRNGGLGNYLKLHFDYPIKCDAWDIEYDYRDKYEVLKARSIEKPMRDATSQWVTMYYEFGKSRITQNIVLNKGVDRIEFLTKVDWHESHKLLRAYFDVNIEGSKATFDIPYGVIERDTIHNNIHQKAQFEVPALSFADFSEGNYGVSVISPHKSGFSVKDNQIGLSLLRSPKYPDPQADMGEHDFTYSIYGHGSGFREGGTVHEAKTLLNPAIAHLECAHTGSLPSRLSFFQTDCSNVIIEALKMSEKGDALVLRVYDSYGQHDKVTISSYLPIKRVEEVNLVEEFIEETNLAGQSISFDLSPYEIKTFKLYLAGF